MESEEVNLVKVEEAEISCVQNIAKRDHVHKTLWKVASVLLIRQEFVERSTFERVKKEQNLHHKYKHRKKPANASS